MSALKRLVIVMAALLALGAAEQANAAVTIVDFEGVPTDYYFSMGNQNLGSYYSGLPNGPTFGPGATIMEQSVTGAYNYWDYPPGSADAVLVSVYQPMIDVTFAQPVSAVSVYYRAGSGLTMRAYDASHQLLSAPATGLGDIPGAPYYDLPPAEYLTVSFATDCIASIRVEGVANGFVLDDFTYWSSDEAIPEPSTLVLWCGLGTVGLAVGLTRRRG